MTISNLGLQEYEVPLRINLQTGEGGGTTRIVCDLHCTDLGNAERFVRHWHDDVRYCRENDTWYIYDDTRWAADTKGVIIEYAKEVVDLIHAEAYYIQGDNPNETKRLRKEVTAWAFKSEAMTRIKAMLDGASSDKRIAISRSVFDAHPSLINCPNGTIDLEATSFEECFREHRRGDMLTMSTRADFDPERVCMYFFSTLEIVLPLDQQVNLQRRIGGNLGGTTKLKEMLLVYGKPYSGKSSITQAVYNALGDYAKPVENTLIAKRKHGIPSNAARPELVALEGVRIAWTEETPEGMVFDEAMLKSLTSSGVKSTRDVYEKQRSLQLEATFVIETNGPPAINAIDEWQRDALLERIGVVPFLYTIPKERRDKEVLRIITEDDDELTAALAWAVYGYFARRSDGLPSTPDIDEGAKRFEADINPLSDFIESEVTFDDGRDDDGKVKHEVSVPVKDLIERLETWADSETLKRVGVRRDGMINPKTFNTHFKRAVPYYAEKAGVDATLKKKERGATWLNVNLRPEKESEREVEEFSTSSARLTNNVENDEYCPKFIKYNLISYTCKYFSNLDHYSSASVKNVGTVNSTDCITASDSDFEGISEELEKLTNNFLPPHVDQATLAQAVKHTLEAWHSANSTDKIEPVERSMLIDAVAARVHKQHTELGLEYIRSFVERLSTENRNIGALLLELTR